MRDEKFSCLSFSSPIRPYPCLRGLSWNFSSRKRERAAKRRGEREKPLVTLASNLAQEKPLGPGQYALVFVALRFARVTRGNAVYKRRTWVYRLTSSGLIEAHWENSWEDWGKKSKRAKIRPILHKNRRHQEPKFRGARARKYRRKCLWLSQFQRYGTYPAPFWAFVIFSSESCKCLTLGPKVCSSAHPGDEING